ncbi:hypothetical protein D9M69_657360 [compost metagenome]
MRIYKTRYDDASRNIYFLFALIAPKGAHDAVTADRNVAFNQFAGYKIKEAATFQHDIGRFATSTLIDHLFKHWLTPFKIIFGINFPKITYSGSS